MCNPRSLFPCWLRRHVPHEYSDVNDITDDKTERMERGYVDDVVDQGGDAVQVGEDVGEEVVDDAAALERLCWIAAIRILVVEIWHQPVGSMAKRVELAVRTHREPSNGA